MIDILLFGPQNITQKFGEYLGNDTKSQSAIIYFEVPNEKFQHPTILRNFPEKLKIYILQTPLLHSVMSPKREFQDANLIIWMFDWNNLNSIQETFGYLKKIVLNRKAFLPIILIGYRENFEYTDDSHLTFLRSYHFYELIKNVIQLPMIYFEITENKTESLFFVKIHKFLEEFHLQMGEQINAKHYSTITLEEIMKTLETFVGTLLEPEFDLDNVYRDLTDYEQKIQQPVTRRYLELNFGCEERIAKRVLDIWDERPVLDQIPEDALKDLETDAMEMFKVCQEKLMAVNFVNLVSLGYNFQVVKYALQFLLKQKAITSISHHAESQEYIQYRNIREVIVIHEGRPLFVKSTNSNEDQTQLFSGMIQAIEMVRDRYLFQAEGIETAPSNRIEFLEFGELKAFIGTGQKNVKLILRLNDRTMHEDDLKQRIKGFLKEYEDQVNLSPTTEFDDMKEIRVLSEKIFYQFFNPFPSSFDVFKEIQVNYDIIDFADKTIIEQKIIEYVKSHGLLLLEDLVDNLNTESQNSISRADFLTYIFDLIKERIIV